MFYQAHSSELNDNSKIFYFNYISNAQLSYHILRGSFKEGLKIIPGIEKGLKQHQNLLDPHRVMVIIYKMGGMYFGDHQWDKAIKYLNRIIHNEHASLRSELTIYSHILLLMSHFELENYGIIHSLVLKIQRQLDQLKGRNELQSLLVKAINDCSKKPKSEHSAIWKKLEGKLEILADDPYEKRAFVFLDALIYVRYKLDNQSISRAVSQKLDSV